MTKKTIIFITILITLLSINIHNSIGAGSSYADMSVAVPEKIRVALNKDSDSVKIAIKGPYKITTLHTDEILKQGDVLWQAEFTPTINGIHLRTYKDEDFKIYGIKIVPQKSPSLHWGQSPVHLPE